MQHRLKEKLEEILEFPFFSEVGGPLPPVVTKVNCWETAATECCKPKWENCQLMARNALQRFVEKKAWSRAAEWNNLIREVRPPVTAFVEQELSSSPIPENILQRIKANLRWDFMFICLEHHFRDVVEPLFYIPFLEPWYAAGHFPCGWDGEELPEQLEWEMTPGRLFVF